MPTSAQLAELEELLGLKYLDYQVQALSAACVQSGPMQRRCLYYKTGAGKTITGLSMMAVWGHDQVLVLTPPATYDQWTAWGDKLGISVQCMSHAKFRMKDTKVSRSVPMIVDEFHLLGGHKGHGWKKLDTLARHLQAPLVLMSATPNYNDAERVYCIQHVLDPHSCKGGYLEFLYAHCNTAQNPFGMEPLVDEEHPFRAFKDAAEYLAALPNVDYLPDDLVYTIDDVAVWTNLPAELETFGLNRRAGRIIASQIEERHARVNHGLVADCGMVWDDVYDIIDHERQKATTPILVYANHSTVADALGESLRQHGIDHAVVTGSTPAKKKAARISSFKANALEVLVGTATLATGTDGLDKVCDTLIILDDTDDASLRRQLIGRIMPRGVGGNASTKRVVRVVLL